jgi:O-antigen/teichoic acid export membrane protein
MMENLSDRVIRSGLWMVAMNLTGRVLGMVRLLVLARLLTPHDFGLVGVALVMISLLQSFSATGLHWALIQRKEGAEGLFDTAWTLGLIRGGVLAGVLVGFAPAVGTFFSSPEAVAIVQVMALTPLIDALQNIGVVELRKELTYGPYYVLHMSGVAADLCVAVPLALWLGNAWALVGGWLALTVVQVVMSYVLHPYRPTLRLNRGEVGELLTYGRWVLGSTALGWLITDGVHAVVGRLLGVQALGLYQMAWRVASLPTTDVTQVVAGVTVAAYAKLQDFPERVRLAYLRVVTVVALFAVPIAVGIGLYGKDLVRFLLGDRWLAVVPIVQILALFGLVRSISNTAGPLFLGMGRPRLQTLGAIVELTLLAGLVGPLSLRLGPAGTAVAVTAGSVAGAAVSLWVVDRLLRVSAAQLASSLGWPLLACLPFVALRVWVLGPIETPVGLIGAIFVSGILYLLGLVLLDRLKLYALDAVLPSGIRHYLPKGVWEGR